MFGTGEAEHAGPAWLSPLAIAIATGGIVLAWLTYQRNVISPAALASAFGPVYRAALARFWIDDVISGIYFNIVLAGARVVGWIDRYLVDGVLNVISAWVVMAGDRLRRVQTGKVQDYVYGVAMGVLFLVIWIGWAR
jgi:NADH:ubiquinone oxidoreductase subunit 5 (subunit L)/multisubunit Na+/H+ antiporter MnhA subunit